MIGDTTTDVFFVHGGVGSAKSYGAVQKHYSWMLDNFDCRFSWYILPTHAKIEDTAIPKWQEWFSKLGLSEGTHFEFIKSPPAKLKIRHKGKEHVIYFQSADRPQLMVGNQIGYFTLDEAGQVKYDVYERAMTRRRDVSAKYVQACVLGQPEGLNWFADIANYNGYNKERNEKSYEVWTEDNAHNLAPGYIEANLKAFGHNKAKVDSWLYGKFRAFHEGQAYPEYDRTSHRCELVPSREIPLTISWDWNYNPLAFVVRQSQWFSDSYGRRTKKLAYLAESSGSSHQIEDACVEFIRRFDPEDGWRNTPIRIQGDATGRARSPRAPGDCFQDVQRNLKKFYSDVKVIAPQHNPLVESRVEATNRLFSYSRIVIDQSCKNLDRSLVNTTWDKKGSRELAKPQGDTWTHWADALGYDVFNETQNELIINLDKPKIIV